VSGLARDGHGRVSAAVCRREPCTVDAVVIVVVVFVVCALVFVAVVPLFAVVFVVIELAFFFVTRSRLALPVLEENGVRLRLTIVDTPGYGDQVNNENCWDPVLRYIKEQYAAFLRKELTPARDRRIPDTRIHCVLFFIAPSGHAWVLIALSRSLGSSTDIFVVFRPAA
jgi:hypothetical protein